MFDPVPCFFQLTDLDCERPAEWMAYFVHEEPGGCDASEPLPVCDYHQKVVRRVNIPFWRVWYKMAPVMCAACQGPLRLNRFESLH